MATIPWSIPTGKAITGATYIKDTDDNIAATIEDLVDWCNNANGTYNDYTLTGLRTDFVDIPSAQTITGAKTFSSPITASGGVTGNVTGNLTGNVTGNLVGTTVKVTGGSTSSVTIDKSSPTLYSGIKFSESDVEKWLFYTVNDGTNNLRFRAYDATSTYRYVFTVSNSTGILDFDNMPSVGGSQITASVAEINALDGYTGSVTELNWMDTLHATGVTATEFDYLDGVTSNIQTQFNSIPTLSSGTYTPTLSTAVNISSSTARTCHYTRVGNTVNVCGQIDVTPSSAATTSFYITLPVSPSTFTSIYDASGTVTMYQAYGLASAVSSTNKVKITYLAPNTSTDEVNFSLSYRV